MNQGKWTYEKYVKWWKMMKNNKKMFLKNYCMEFMILLVIKGSVTVRGVGIYVYALNLFEKSYERILSQK